jgi:hypothetical protein
MQEDKGELVAEALAVLLHLNEELATKLLSAREQAQEASRDSAKGRDALSEYREFNVVR